VQPVKNKTTLNKKRGVMRINVFIFLQIVGALSDKSTCRFGRRRPFIIAGAFFTCLFMLGVAFAKEIGGDAYSSQISGHTVVSFFVLPDLTTFIN
jgi:Na+/melibiose symporter-like transporter